MASHICSPYLGGKVQLPASLADEADPQHDTRHAGYLGLATAHVAEGAPAQFTLRQLGQRVSRSRTGHVYGGQAAGYVGDVDLPVANGEPPFEPLLDKLDVAGGRGDEETVGGEARNGAVVPR